MDIDVCGYVELLEYGADCFGLGLAEWGWAVVLLAAGLSGGLDCVEIVVEITVNIYSQYPVFAFFLYPFCIQIFAQIHNLFLC